MRVASTRSPHEVVSFRDALFQGLAPDGGLYSPASSYELGPLFLRLSPELDFPALAAEVLQPLLGDEIPSSDLKALCQQAFPFSPRLYRLEDFLLVLELFHGPSAAFKDFGASFLATTMSWFLQNEERRSIILTATSGDTGSAVAMAFHGKPNIDVVILYPSGRVSPLQEKQLTTLGGNVHAVEVQGSFDDCQRLVKEAFLDRSLSPLGLTSANSINLGRLLPQSLYYIWAFVQLKATIHDELVFTVPSGNFGNLTAGVYAWKWGLPVARFLAATNANDVVPEYLRTHRFRPRASVATLSNAMDVGNPSNFERLEALFQRSAELMGALIEAQSVSDAETLQTMRSVWEAHRYAVCPHTAVGLRVALDRYRSSPGDEVCHVVLATAHPAKFVEVMERATGYRPPLPPQLERVLNLPKQSVPIAPDLNSLRRFLLDTFG